MPEEKSDGVKHDVFLSYANQDKERVERLVHALDAEGWDVFWDQEIPPGKEWESWILPRLEAAAVVIPVWSTQSVKSRYVRQEADIALKRGVLVPVSIDEVEPPFGFRHLQALTLVSWLRAGSGPLPGLLKTTIKSMLSETQTALPAANEPMQEQSREKRRGGRANTHFNRVAAICAALLIIAGLAVLLYFFTPYPLAKQDQRQATVTTKSEPPAGQPVKSGTSVGMPSGAGGASTDPVQTAQATPTLPAPAAASGNRTNLLSRANGGEVLVAPSTLWLRTNDDKEEEAYWFSTGSEAVYGFRDEKPVTFDTFTVLIPDTSQYNLKDFELLVGDDSPTGSFRSIGRFSTLNARLMRAPYQEFKFAPVTAKYLKVRLLQTHGANSIQLYEFQLMRTQH